MLSESASNRGQFLRFPRQFESEPRESSEQVYKRPGRRAKQTWACRGWSCWIGETRTYPERVRLECHRSPPCEFSSDPPEAYCDEVLPEYAPP